MHNYPFSCSCHQSPCCCGAAYSTGEPSIVIVPAGSQIVQTPQPIHGCGGCSPTLSATVSGSAASSTTHDGLDALTGSFTAPPLGSQFILNIAQASVFIRPGDILHFPGWGQAEVISVSGSTLTARNLSIAEGVILVAGQEVRVESPLDPYQLGRSLCGTPGGQAASFLGCIDGTPKPTNQFSDAAIPLASESELSAGFAPLARLNGNGAIRRVAPVNGKALISRSGQWVMEDYTPGIVHLSTWPTLGTSAIVLSASHTLFSFTPSGLPGYSSAYGTMWLKAYMQLTAAPGYFRYTVFIGGKEIMSHIVKTQGASNDGDSNGSDLVFPFPVSAGTVEVTGSASISVSPAVAETAFTLKLMAWQR